MRDRQLQLATQQYFALNAFTNPCAVTLTLKQADGWTKIDPISASTSFRHFRNRLNKALYGSAARRYGKFVPMISVIERSAANRYHYHCAIDRPDKTDSEAFELLIRKCWGQTPFGYREIHFQHSANSGWLNYITKSSQKESFGDSIDWLNTTIQTVE